MGKTILEYQEAKIPEEVEVTINQKRVVIKGQLGEIKKDFSYTPVLIKKTDDKVLVEAVWPNKKNAAIVKTVLSRIKNMIDGVTKGFTYKLKIVFAHFPISVKVQNSKVLIENFYGERSPRVANIIGDTKVEVGSEDIIVKGLDIDEVSQTAANIQQATRIKRYDPRVFLDGIYVYEKTEGI
jgi:large subunit ribosomal protein L6